MMTEYDTRNLRNNVSFETVVFPKITWVPFNCLGKTRHTNKYLGELSNASSAELIKSQITNPYELIQYLQVNDFKKKIDYEYKTFYGIKWEVHNSGQNALLNKEGCCASLAGLFSYILSDNFLEIYHLNIMSNLGNGHVVNFIIKDGAYYFYDLYAQLNEFCDYITVETGLKKDFVRSKYITGVCLKTDSIQNYIIFFEKYNILKKREFIYYISKSDVIPSIAVEISNNKLKLMLRKSDDIYIIKQKELESIGYDLID